MSPQRDAAPWRQVAGHWLATALDGVAALALFALMSMTCIDVVGRYLFNSPLDGATELTKLLVGVVVFAVLASVSRREDHVNVDLMDLWFPGKLVNARQILINVLLAAVMGVVSWNVWILADRAAEYGDTTEYLGIPLAPMGYFICIMCSATAVASLANVPRYLKGRGPLSPATERGKQVAADDK